MRRYLCLIACGWLAACGIVSGADDFEVDSSANSSGNSGGGGSGGGSGGGGALPTCPGGRGPDMVLVEAGWGYYCVDSTEVTNEQYAAFIAAQPEPSLSDARCGWKGDYNPRADGTGSCFPAHSDAVNFPDRPVACVDWCDARKFCNWSRKRLCGGAEGRTLPYTNLTDLESDEWYVACSADGAVNYPYGDSYVGSRCVGDDYDGVPGDGSMDNAEAVGAAKACEGGFAGLFDMSGNVHEWVDSCENVAAVAASDQRCRARGGSFWDGAGSMTCAFAFDAWQRSSYANNIGFRCCADVEASQ